MWTTIVLCSRQADYDWDDNDEIYVSKNDPMATYVTKVMTQVRDGSKNGYGYKSSINCYGNGYG